MEELLKQLKEGKDPYRQLAAHVLGKNLDDVTRDERQRFKEAFYAAFHFRGPDLIKSCFEDLRELDKLPAVREHLRKKARES
jgi:hypothetical protein